MWEEEFNWFQYLWKFLISDGGAPLWRLYQQGGKTAWTSQVSSPPSLKPNVKAATKVMSKVIIVFCQHLMEPYLSMYLLERTLSLDNIQQPSSLVPCYKILRSPLLLSGNCSTLRYYPPSPWHGIPPASPLSWCHWGQKVGFCSFKSATFHRKSHTKYILLVARHLFVFLWQMMFFNVALGILLHCTRTEKLHHSPHWSPTWSSFSKCSAAL